MGAAKSEAMTVRPTPLAKAPLGAATGSQQGPEVNRKANPEVNQKANPEVNQSRRELLPKENPTEYQKENLAELENQRAPKKLEIENKPARPKLGRLSYFPLPF